MKTHLSINENKVLDEFWKDVKGYEGYYQISSFGRIRSLDRYVNHPLGGKKIVRGAIKKLNLCSNGYYIVSLYKDNFLKGFIVHNLVWDTFGKGKRNGRKLQIDHKDNNKLNNKISNLQLLTGSQNIQKYYDTIDTASKYPRVYLDNRTNRWEASLRINGKNKHIGYFKTELEAHKANLKYKKNFKQ